MFTRKYIFETAQTRYRRYLANFAFFIFILSIFYIIFAFYLVYYGTQQTKTAKELMFNKSPDLIAVYTGDLGRIPFAVELSKNHKNAKLFISGVDYRNHVQRLINLLGKTSKEELDPNFVEIDYQARNTVENVIFTLRYLRDRPALKKVVIISHDYHLYRISSIFETLLDKDEKQKYELIFYGVPTELSKWRSLKIIYTEVYKIFKAQAFLMLWGDGPSS